MLELFAGSIAALAGAGLLVLMGGDVMFVGLAAIVLACAWAIHAIGTLIVVLTRGLFECWQRWALRGVRIERLGPAVRQLRDTSR